MLGLASTVLQLGLILELGLQLTRSSVQRQPSTPTGVGLAGQRQPSQAAKKPSVLRSVSAKLRRPLGNVPPIGMTM